MKSDKFMPKFLVSVVCLLVSIAVGAVLDWPRYKDLKAARAGIAQKQIDIKYADEKAAGLAEIEEKLAGFTEELEKIDSALPSDPDLPSLFLFLEAAAEKDGLRMGEFPSVSMPADASRPGLKEISFSFSVSGPYSAFKNYLETLRSTARLIQVESFSFSAPKNENSSIFSFTIGAKTQSY